jgi:putative ABC transport system substrate-binding protein
VVAGGNVLSAGLVANIAHSEGNITGVSTNAGETYGKWVELLKETVPSLSHLAIVTSSISGSNDQAIERIADAFRLQSRWSRLSSLDELPSTLATAKADGADGLVVLSSAVISNGSDPRIGSAVLKSRLPAVAEGRDFAVNGGLLAHGTVPGSNPRRAASYVDKVLRGAKPGDLPIELPTEFAIVVNLNTVRDLGITVPQSVLQRATEIIQ